MAEVVAPPSSSTGVEEEMKLNPTSKVVIYTDKSCRLPAAKCLSASFNTDPVLRWVMTPTSRPSLITNDSFRDLFFNNAILSLILAAKGYVVDADGTSRCVGLLVPPHRNTDALSVYVKSVHRLIPVVLKQTVAITKRCLITYPATLHYLRHLVFPPASPNPLLKSRLANLTFFYLYFLGTLPSARGNGLGRAVMEHIKTLAAEYPVDASEEENQGRSRGVPVYFECSLDRSRVFYESLGFRTVGAVRVGRGEVDGEGFTGENRKSGKGTKGAKGQDLGEAVGVRLWAMVWWPDGMWPEGVEYWDGKTELEV